ncbi:hypothetical protein Y695_02566 [Hydrogenophaga sp. T4]|nr:hypothetical protein Y695_02566 [Hydrogenophaga sp. T4]
MGHTAPTLNSGTHTPMITAMSCRPCGPATLSARARAMKELKRKPICALAACSRTSSRLPSQGQCGSEYESPMPSRPSVKPAAMRLEVAPRSSGLFTMDWNSSTGNRK